MNHSRYTLFELRYLRIAYVFFVSCSIAFNAVASNPDFSNKPSDDLAESPLSLSLNGPAIIVDASHSIISVGQYGLNNITNILQAGNASNTSNVFQRGNVNIAVITQFGSGNEVNLIQENNANYVEIIQDGFDNVANINQTGEQAFIVRQIGNEMVVNITQYIE
ncbi:curlin subunit CsgB [Agaribacter marinus]|uniref:Curlin subunit CsgB n=1 Tax=Agaribacter marinus TaxID=1431249 RepID=A0AA37WJH3_9ALTE|nr:curlin subunit CsgB [Agaribacter marinus]GLR69785.1 hypothetical protein GCM10007852_06930 [Agaribacter marinus]